MLDYFLLLQVPRRPWLDEELVKQNFFALSAPIHPDRSHNASPEEKASAHRQFTELNAAWQCLREPKDRLGHLLELETGARPGDTSNVPPAAIELSFAAGSLCREADQFLTARAKTSSPLLQAGMFAQGMELTERLQELQRQITTRREVLLAELQAMNAVWEAAPEPGSTARAATLPLPRLEEVYRMLGYIARWSGQLQERLTRISF